MSDSPSAVVEEEGHSSPVLADPRGQHPQYSHVELLRPVIADVSDGITNIFSNHLWKNHDG
jgi:hypothetical protein